MCTMFTAFLLRHLYLRFAYVLQKGRYANMGYIQMLTRQTFLYAKSKPSGESALLRRLVWVFISRQFYVSAQINI